MKLDQKNTMGRIGLCALAGVLFAGLSPSAVHADSTEEIINLLKAKNIITADEAAQILERHKSEAGQMPPATGSKPVTIVMPKGQRYPKATTDPVTKDIKEEVARQVREELKDAIAKEVKREASASSALDWSKRIRFGGDIRLRYQDDFFDDNNSQPFSPADPTQLVNRNIDRDRLVYRARLSAIAQVNDQTEAGLRLATGSEKNPVSTNDILGDYMNKDTVTFDLAYLKWTPLADASALPGKLDLWGGRLPNPFISTDLVWDDDLNFEGVAANLAIPINARMKGFVNAGAFPLQEEDFSSRDKWLLGGQVGLQYSRSNITYTLAAAYYDYQNVQGQRNPYTLDGEGPNDYTAPLYQQMGNVVFDLNQYNSDATLFALAADYNEINLTGKVDIGIFDPIHVIVLADYVQNIGFDSAEVSALTGENVPEDDTGYMVGLTVGHPRMENLWDWQTSLAYKYLEADAVLDAYTDSDFHLGGTNAKGWILGGQLGLGKNLWLRARWLSSDAISGPPSAVDTFQLDINTRF
ncbi:putative porin [Desulfobulbus elongatus]|uniref:putative porin n=1 Tax=Desulfobulbus elongatus TaxID=53332 RepID=UPI000684CD0E|nr:putative porin [Desulfobulbus elongatus]